jgi:integrase
MLREDHGAPQLANKLRLPTKPRPRNVRITIEERDLLVESAPPHARVWLLLCSDLAMRSGTAARIAPCHINTTNHTVTFTTKNGATQSLHLTRRLIQLLAPYCTPPPGTAAAWQNFTPSPPAKKRRGYNKPPRPTPWTSETPFITLLHPQHTQIVPQAMRSWWARHVKRLGMRKDIRPHDLRRATAVRMYEQVGDVRAVQALLGHRDTTSTWHYLDHDATHPTPQKGDPMTTTATPTATPALSLAAKLAAAPPARPHHPDGRIPRARLLELLAEMCDENPDVRAHLRRQMEEGGWCHG